MNCCSRCREPVEKPDDSAKEAPGGTPELLCWRCERGEIRLRGLKYVGITGVLTLAGLFAFSLSETKGTPRIMVGFTMGFTVLCFWGFLVNTVSVISGIEDVFDQEKCGRLPAWQRYLLISSFVTVGIVGSALLIWRCFVLFLGP